MKNQSFSMAVKRHLMTVLLLPALFISPNAVKATESSLEFTENYSGPASVNGKLIRLVELKGKSLADTKLNPKQEQAHLKSLSKQKAQFRTAANVAGIKFVERSQFDVLFNALSIEVDAKDLEKLEALDMNAKEI